MTVAHDAELGRSSFVIMKAIQYSDIARRIAEARTEEERRAAAVLLAAYYHWAPRVEPVRERMEALRKALEEPTA